MDEFPELGELSGHGLGGREDDRLVLTAAGLERSDTIGPALFSRDVQRRMEESDLS